MDRVDTVGIQMKILIRYAWVHSSANLWATVALIVASWFFCSVPTLAASKSGSPEHHTSKIARNGSHKHWIEVDLSRQRLIAWEGGKPTYTVPISSGKHSTPTHTGTFAVQTKYRSTRMQGRDYKVPDVPYAMYYSGSYAIHGAYWHNQFGTPVSHGCVNTPIGAARKLFHWASVGTSVVVHD